MKSCCSLPALRTVNTASGMCSPVAHASARFGEALQVRMAKLKSCMFTLPDPPPPPEPALPELDSPQENDSTWISALCFLSEDSPAYGSPLILRNMSTAIASLLFGACRVGAGPWRHECPICRVRCLPPGLRAESCTAQLPYVRI